MPTASQSARSDTSRSPSMPDDVVHFHEIQRPRWTLGVALLAGAWALALVLPLLIEGRQPNAFQYVQSVILLGAIVSSMSRLRTVVEGHTLELERRWGARLTVDLDRLRAVREAPYYVRIDGGWGVRNGRGAILTFEDGNVIYVGSARAEVLCEVLRGLIPSRRADSLACTEPVGAVEEAR